jgi:hypothetical protein
MSGKRIEDNVSYDNILQLNTYINEWTKDLEPMVGERARLYVTLRPAWSWNENQLQELLMLVRYEVATIHLSKALDQFREDTDFNDEKQRKKFIDISRSLNSALRDTQTLRTSLGLSVAQSMGDLRALKSSTHKEMKIREIAPTGSVSSIEEARQNAKRMLA